MLLDTLLDVLKMAPILFVVYILIEIIQSMVSANNLSDGSTKGFAPLAGALAGCVPQCGFSAAAAVLYKNKLLSAGTLVAVFIATSDEAIPVLLSHADRLPDVILLILVKLAAAVLGGYAVWVFGRVFYGLRRKKSNSGEGLKNAGEDSGEDFEHGEEESEHFHDCHHPCRCRPTVKGVLKHSTKHTLKISAFVLITLAVVNVLFYLIGEQNISAALLSGNVFQPFLTALIGIIPGCATSVLITELYIGGTLSFGSAVAGLCTGAGFGYIILFKDKAGLKQNFAILLQTYIVAVLTGVIINLFI